MYEDIKVWQLSMIGLMSVVAVVILVLFLQVVYWGVSAQQVYDNDFSQPPAELSNLRAEQQARLLEYRVIDRQKKVVAIPVKEAEQLVLQELARREAPPKE